MGLTCQDPAQEQIGVVGRRLSSSVAGLELVVALSDRHVCRREGARETREAARQERVRPAVASTRMARARSTPPAHVEPATGRPPLTPPTLTTLFGFSICHISPFSTINTISSSLHNYVTIFDKKKTFWFVADLFCFFCSPMFRNLF